MAEWSATTIFERDAYWLGFAADAFVDLGADAGLEPGDPEAADDVRAYGRALGEMATPIVAASGRSSRTGWRGRRWPRATRSWSRGRAR